MVRARMVYVSDTAHQRLKALAVRGNRSMGKVVEDLVEREVVELANPWTNLDGLALQGRVLQEVWGDPAMEVYDDE